MGEEELRIMAVRAGHKGNAYCGHGPTWVDAGPDKPYDGKDSALKYLVR